ncbi:MAG TPA: L,D-transpeptidase [Candidatus Dormibacteraeota bacterium]|nr:L,D-transpeptidase [Candidatus Dormibacteraeota bacterium]
MRRRLLPAGVSRAALRTGVRCTRWLLTVDVAEQRLILWQRARTLSTEARFPPYIFQRSFVVSTSRFGVGQLLDSKQTPLGLHRVARKIGGGDPVGTVFRGRQPVGFTWQGQPDGTIVHRILWLEGLEPGLNRGGAVDTFRRYIYIHGYGDELTLGRPQSCGCIHLAASDLIPLYDRLPVGTLVWIG